MAESSTQESGQKISRREFIKLMGLGLGALTLNSIMGERREGARPEIGKFPDTLADYQLGWEARPWVWVNLAVASTYLDGLVIRPGEEISTIKAIRLDQADKLDPQNMDPRLGYVAAQMSDITKLSGLGYGLCLGSTAIFRAALGSPLRIMEAGTHYDQYPDYFQDMPIGTDAAIFYPGQEDKIPATDLRLKNTTGSDITLRFAAYDHLGERIRVPQAPLPFAEYKAAYLDQFTRILQRKLDGFLGIESPDQFFPHYMFGNEKITVRCAFTGRGVNWGVEMSNPKPIQTAAEQQNYEYTRRLTVRDDGGGQSYLEVYRSQYGIRSELIAGS